MSILVLAFLIGVIAGLRACHRPGCRKLGSTSRLDQPLRHPSLAWLGYAATPWIFSILALGEIVNDKLPATPSRKIPPQFITRIVSGASSPEPPSASPTSPLISGLLLGAIGAVAGTLGGADIRARLAKAFGNDLPAALLEDFVAVVGGLCIVHNGHLIPKCQITSTPSSSGPARLAPPSQDALTKAGLTVAMIERKLFGGTCVNTGCIPTKTLIATAYAVREARRAEFFGFKLPGPHRDEHEGRQSPKRHRLRRLPHSDRRLAPHYGALHCLHRTCPLRIPQVCSRQR